MRPKRHVLIVPAWYPNPRQPILGVFIREQAKALQRFAPDTNVSVWDWRPGLFAASFKRPLEMLRSFRRWQERSAPSWVTDPDGLRVYVRPVFERPRPFSSETRALADAFREAIRAATEARGRIDLIHAHVGYNAGWACAKVCPEFRIPWVLTEHMGPAMLADLAPRGVLQPRLAKVYRDCRALIAVSTAHARTLERYCGRLPTVIPNVFDEDFFSPNTLPPAPDAAFLVVAALRPVKAIDLLLRAYAHALATRDLPPLIIGGDGPLRLSLERLSASLGLAKRVRFLGTLAREQVRDEMRRAAALVISSHSESFGVVAIEAMGCGRPVLSTACGGPQDIVSRETGIVVPVDDVAALAAGLVEMARRVASFDCRAIRQTAEARFGRPAIADRLCRLYDTVPAGSTTGLPT